MAQETFIGVDLADKTHVAVNESGEVERVSAEAATATAWIDKLVSMADSPVLLVEDPRSPLVLGALLQGIAVESVNPYRLSRYRSATSAANAKDDVRDAKTLIEFRKACPDAFHRLVSPVESRETLRITLIEREQGVEDRLREANRLREDLKIANPVLLETFSQGLRKQWFLKALIDHPTSLDATEIQDEVLLRRVCKELGCSREVAIQRLGVNPALGEGAHADAWRQKIVRSATRLLDLLRHNAELERKLGRLQDELAKSAERATDERPHLIEVLRSFPGLGPNVLAMLLVEVPELLDNVVPDKQALVARTGVKPVTKQSGSTRIVSMRRQRSIRLLNAMMYMTDRAKLNSPRIRDRYQRSRDRGKGHWTAMRITARLALDILHSMLRNRNLYHEPLLTG